MPSTNPHDVFFKAVFSQPEITADLIREFFPPELTQFIDTSTLKLENASYVDEELDEYFADLVFSCKMAEKHVRISLLFEHKSNPVKDIWRQLWRYLLNGMNRQQQQGQDPHLIIPVLFYHGKRAWSPESLGESVGPLPDALKQYLPDFEFVYINLHEMPLDRLWDLRNAVIRCVLLLMKQVWEQAFILEHFAEIIIFTSAYRFVQPEQLKNQSIVYLTTATDLTKESLMKFLAPLPKPNIENPQNAYDEIAKEGYEYGVERGIKDGMEKGMEKGIKKGIEKDKIDVIHAAHREGLPSSLIASIVGWAEDKVLSVINKGA